MFHFSAAFPKDKYKGQNSKQISMAKYISKFLIHGAKMLDKCVKIQKICTLFFFCKVKLSKMVSTKNKQNKRNRQHFSNLTFHNIQLCFWSCGYSSPLKVLKMYLVFGKTEHCTVYKHAYVVKIMKFGFRVFFQKFRRFQGDTISSFYFLVSKTSLIT